MSLSPRAEDQRTLRLSPTPASAAPARSWVRDQLSHIPSLEQRDTAVLLVSELVTNAVRHAGTDLLVELSFLDEAVLLAVSDGSTRPAYPKNPALLAEGGRGLALVDALATRWGVTANPYGKRVWAELGAQGPAPSP